MFSCFAQVEFGNSREDLLKQVKLKSRNLSRQLFLLSLSKVEMVPESLNYSHTAINTDFESDMA